MTYPTFTYAFQLLLNHHDHQVVTSLDDDDDDDDDDLVKLEKLKPVWSIILKLSNKY